MLSYNTVRSHLVDKMAPLKTKTIKLVPDSTCFNEEYSEIRKLCRKTEEKYRKSGLGRTKGVT